MSDGILKIYKILQKKFGQQNWWPTTPPGEIHPRYIPVKKLTTNQKWEVVVGAILTQNTSWKNVEKALANLNKVNFFTNSRSIFSFSLSQIKDLIKPAGFYNQKALYLKNFIDYVEDKYNGDLEKFLDNPSIENLRKELLGLKGIGPETADSIILYAAQKPTFVVDAYTIRIFNRLCLCSSSNRYSEVKNYIEKDLASSNAKQKLFSEFHALLVKVGKEFCRKNKPLCRNCPLYKVCEKKSNRR